VCADDTRPGERLRIEGAKPLDLRVQPCLEVLEHLIEAENCDVVRRLRDCGASVSFREREEADCSGSGRRRRAAQEIAARNREGGSGRLAHRAVDVDLSERRLELVMPRARLVDGSVPHFVFRNRVDCSVRTASWELTPTSAARGAGGTPARSLIQAAWRPSTETI